MSSEIFGYSDEKTLKYAESLGIAMQLTNILRDVKEDAAMNRIYLPLEDLQKFGVTDKQIFAGEFDKNFVELMKFEIERARNYYAEAEKGISLLEKDLRKNFSRNRKAKLQCFFQTRSYHATAKSSCCSENLA
jgi:phytoene synthase